MKNRKLWGIFILIVALTLIFSFLATTVIIFVSIHLGLLKPFEPVSWLPSINIGLTAILIAMGLTTVISRHLFLPIQNLIHALDEVASGNFKVQLPENGVWSEIREMNMNFNKMVKELNSTEMLQSDFIQNVSHEIKTPLAAIEGYVSLLSQSSISGQEKEYLDRIQESTRQLSSLTGNILKLSKLENQQVVAEKHVFSLDEQIRQVIVTMEPLWSKKQLDMDIHLPETRYYGNEDLMVQIWSNLLSNAIKFTPENGLVSVRLSWQDSSICIRISDSGIGMSEEIQRHIFDKFYQAESSRSIEGNGLGLALVKKILALCGGSITVSSRPGFGSTFTVLLPQRTSNDSMIK